MVVALVPMEVNNCVWLAFLAHQNTVYYPEHYHLCGRGGGKCMFIISCIDWHIWHQLRADRLAWSRGAHINNKWYNEDHNGYPEVFVSW